MKNLYLSNMICGDVYPDNRLGEFTNYLNQPLKGSWSAGLNEMYYVPHTWHNIRYPGNAIQIKISSMIRKEVVGFECVDNQQGGYRCRQLPNYEIKYHTIPGEASFHGEIPVGNYVDIFDLLGKVLYAMNLAIITYFQSLS